MAATQFRKSDLAALIRKIKTPEDVFSFVEHYRNLAKENIVQGKMTSYQQSLVKSGIHEIQGQLQHFYNAGNEKNFLLLDEHDFEEIANDFYYQHTSIEIIEKTNQLFDLILQCGVIEILAHQPKPKPKLQVIALPTQLQKQKYLQRNDAFNDIIGKCVIPFRKGRGNIPCRMTPQEYRALQRNPFLIFKFAKIRHWVKDRMFPVQTKDDAIRFNEQLAQNKNNAGYDPNNQIRYFIIGNSVNDVMHNKQFIAEFLFGKNILNGSYAIWTAIIWILWTQKQNEIHKINTPLTDDDLVSSLFPQSRCLPHPVPKKMKKRRNRPVRATSLHLNDGTILSKVSVHETFDDIIREILFSQETQTYGVYIGLSTTGHRPLAKTNLMNAFMYCLHSTKMFSERNTEYDAMRELHYMYPEMRMIVNHFNTDFGVIGEIYDRRIRTLSMTSSIHSIMTKAKQYPRSKKNNIYLKQQKCLLSHILQEFPVLDYDYENDAMFITDKFQENGMSLSTMRDYLMALDISLCNPNTKFGKLLIPWNSDTYEFVNFKNVFLPKNDSKYNKELLFKILEESKEKHKKVDQEQRILKMMERLEIECGIVLPYAILNDPEILNLIS